MDLYLSCYYHRFTRIGFEFDLILDNLYNVSVDLDCQKAYLPTKNVADVYEPNLVIKCS